MSHLTSIFCLPKLRRIRLGLYLNDIRTKIPSLLTTIFFVYRASTYYKPFQCFWSHSSNKIKGMKHFYHENIVLFNHQKDFFSGIRIFRLIVPIFTVVVTFFIILMYFLPVFKVICDEYSSLRKM